MDETHSRPSFIAVACERLMTEPWQNYDDSPGHARGTAAGRLAHREKTQWSNYPDGKEKRRPPGGPPGMRPVIG
ncbi:hypothetical protein BAU08_23980 [Bordetella bronchialis]|uniref:Uncharacterized protein n=1 Tax=Bordetella bronchialis TaxID=463025 RepID=A0A193G1W9_9BORD|nr:hypothetical protein BAU08_23980 [Bordetella bronchialis]